MTNDAKRLMPLEERLESVVTRIESLEGKSHAARWWDAATKAATVVLIPISVWLVGLEVRISAVEGNRFTDRDGRALEDRIMERIPPPQVQMALTTLAADILEIKTMLRDQDARLRNIEVKVK